MEQKTKIHIVPHTHWDREWYYTLEEYRYHLIGLMDTLIDSMERNAITYFVLDGQTIMLRDYLELRNENRERLSALIQAGRLLIGPWFTQPNIFMSCAEAQVQNLLVGRRDMKQWGGGMYDINYMPDQFGFHTQLPQMMENFGLTYLVGGRGMPKGCDTYLLWKGSDETVVGVCAMIHTYINACGLSDRVEPKIFNLFLGETIQMPSLPDRVDLILSERLRSISPQLLGLNGVDHMYPNPQLPKAIEKILELYPDIEVEQSNFRLYIDETEKTKEREPVTVQGELIDGRENLVLTAAQSSRMDVKKYNRKMENLMLRRVEPLLTHMAAVGEDNLPLAEYNLAWDYLLQNHAHDSLCCGNSEPSYREILTRYDKINDICREICNDLEQRLLRRIIGTSEEGLLVVNPTPKERAEPVTIEVIVSNHRDFAEPHLFYEDQEITAQVQDARNDWLLRYVPFSGLVGQLQVTIFTMTIDPGVLPPMGYKMLTIRGGGLHDRTVSGLVKSPRRIENEFLDVSVENDATITVHDKRNGITYSGLNVFMDDGEAGNCFIHKTPYGDYTAVSSGAGMTVDIKENNMLRGVLSVNQFFSVPTGLSSGGLKRSEERVDLSIHTRITLRSGCPFLEFDTDIENKAKDHRLRVAFPSDTVTEVCYAGQPFDVVTRPIQPDNVNHYEKDDYEALVGYHPMDCFCGISDSNSGFTVAADEAMEYEVLHMRNMICLTLLRATDRELVGVLEHGSKFKLPTAQLLGMQSYRYAFIPHNGSFEESLPIVEQFRNPLYAIQKDFLSAESMPDYQTALQVLTTSESFFKVDGDVVFSRLKPAEDHDGAILRLYNPSGESRCAVLQMGDGFILRSAELSQLDESIGKSLEIKRNAVKLELGAKKIATLRVHVFRK